jgi:hypothetical protein
MTATAAVSAVVFCFFEQATASASSGSAANRRLKFGFRDMISPRSVIGVTVAAQGGKKPSRRGLGVRQLGTFLWLLPDSGVR